MKVMVKYGEEGKTGIDLLADSSILPTQRPLFVPDWAHDFKGTAALAVRISRLGKCIAPRFAHRYWDAVAPCMLTRGVDDSGNLVEQSALTRVHDGALVLGLMTEKGEILTDTTLRAASGSTQWCDIAVTPLCAQVDDLLAMLSQYVTIKTGDLLCLPTDASMLLPRDQVVQMWLGERNLLQTRVK